MRKLMKLMTVTAITSISTFQVVACKDDSLNEQFMTDVENSERYNSAFFGFLGSADNEASKDLQDIFDYLNQEDKQGNSLWKDWKNKYAVEIEEAKLEDIQLTSYQGPAHDPAPSDPIEAFWNDKGITWQKNIFDWVYSKSNSTDNPSYHRPEGYEAITEITTIKDTSDKERFETLPVIFIVKKGRLITSGQNWIPTTENWQRRVDAVGEFILKNLILTEAS